MLTSIGKHEIHDLMENNYAVTKIASSDIWSIFYFWLYIYGKNFCRSAFANFQHLRKDWSMDIYFFINIESKIKNLPDVGQRHFSFTMEVRKQFETASVIKLLHKAFLTDEKILWIKLQDHKTKKNNSQFGWTSKKIPFELRFGMNRNRLRGNYIIKYSNTVICWILGIIRILPDVESNL